MSSSSASSNEKGESSSSSDDSSPSQPQKPAHDPEAENDDDASRSRIHPAFASVCSMEILQQRLEPFNTYAQKALERTGRSVDWNQISIQSILGDGGFCTVFSVTVNNSNTTNTTEPTSFALKRVSSKHCGDREETFVVAASDLAYEAYLLSKLPHHQNWVQLYGVCPHNLTDSFLASSGGIGYYFLMEELQAQTLEDKLEQWRQNSTDSSIPSLERRLEHIAIPAADAVRFLHQHQCLLRDLKPLNMGFSKTDGTLKLFDLGLARPINKCHRREIAGSIRYMAPEVVQHDLGTGYPCDVYSFALVLYESTTLNRPYQRYFPDDTDMDPSQEAKLLQQFRKRVVERGERPPLPKLPSRRQPNRKQLQKLYQLIQDGWHANACARPTFARIWLTLHELIQTEEQQGLDYHKSSRLQQVTLPKEDQQPRRSRFKQFLSSCFSRNQDEDSAADNIFTEIEELTDYGGGGSTRRSVQE